jgi:hypothetical protein
MRVGRLPWPGNGVESSRKSDRSAMTVPVAVSKDRHRMMPLLIGAAGTRAGIRFMEFFGANMPWLICCLDFFEPEQ